MTLVVDASVAFKWFVYENGSDAAAALIASGEPLIAPDLLVPELCNAAATKLRRNELTAEQARAMVGGVPDLFDELVPSAEIAAGALEIATALAHPAYDCFYLAVAEQRGARMVTDDRRLLSKLANTRWAPLVMKLDDVAV